MENNYFKNFGIMVDCSRNAVRSVDSLKKFMDYMALMGYNMLQLYTEDTFEVDNEARFGYLRGRYSKEELKDLNKYAKTKGIKLVPCIQTLAHLNQIFRWAEYREINDCNDILLCDNERTYILIENMFKTVRECFDCEIINIGMDEAQMLGLGKYLKQNGYKNRFDIILRHLKKVCEIANKYNFKPMIWSDMFFRISSPTSSYYTEEFVKFSDEIINLVPDELSLVYWDYYSQDSNRYDTMMKMHKQFKNDIWFAGGCWCWGTLCPHNEFSLKTTMAGMESAIKNKVENMFLTLWGDDGAECSYIAMLPTLFYASCLAKGENDMLVIKRKFKEMFNINFDEFMYLDLADSVCKDSATHVVTPSKNILYNDLFLGMFDKEYCLIHKENYKSNYNLLADIEDNKDFGYLFKCQQALNDLCYLKIDMGQRIRKGYKENDRELLKVIISDLDLLLEKVKIYYDAFKTVWFRENKPHGFDVQDIRLGGLIQRIKSCKQRLIYFVNGEIKEIPELDEEILNFEGGSGLIYHYKIASPNRIV